MRIKTKTTPQLPAAKRGVNLAVITTDMKRTMQWSTWVLMIILMQACAAGNVGSKKGFSPEGSWSTVIENTPLGTMNGTMNIRPEGDNWVGELTASGYGTFTLRNVRIEERKLKANFNFEGVDLEVDGEFTDDDTLSGMLYAMGDGFPFKGSRVKG
jgi:hypothetical protein